MIWWIRVRGVQSRNCWPSSKLAHSIEASVWHLAAWAFSFMPVWLVGNMQLVFHEMAADTMSGPVMHARDLAVTSVGEIV